MSHVYFSEETGLTIRKRLEASKNEIIERYRRGDTRASIANDFNCTSPYITTFLKEWGEEIPTVNKPSPELKTQIIELYRAGHSAYIIDKMLNLKTHVANRCLRDEGFDISGGKKGRDVPLSANAHEIISQYESGDGVDTIAKRFNTFGCNVNKLLRKNGVKIRKLRDYSHKVDESFFDVVDTEHKAYLLGLFMADGCNRQKQADVRISLTDECLVRFAADAMGFDGKIKVKHFPDHPKHQSQYELRFGSRKMSDALARLGCGSRKTYSATFPGEDIVPHDLTKHLLRGWL